MIILIAKGQGTKNTSKEKGLDVKEETACLHHVKDHQSPHLVAVCGIGYHAEIALAISNSDP